MALPPPIHQGAQVIEGTRQNLGYVQDTTISAASPLPSIPDGARYAIIQVTGKNCRWRDDGTAPTTTVGSLLAVGESFFYAGELSKFQIIETEASAVLNVSYYK